MRRYWYIVVISCGMLCGCNSNSSWGEFATMLVEGWVSGIYGLFQGGHSIEKDGLEGCDTVPLPGDKEQIAASILANMDTLWVQMRDSLAKHPEVKPGKYIWEEKSKFLYDPAAAYSGYIYYINQKDPFEPMEDSRIFLPERPSKFYHAWTDLIVYSKDKLLCWAFVVTRQDTYRGGKDKPPYYHGWNVIGKRKSINEPFKIFVRNRDQYNFDSEGMYIIELMENEALYIPGVNTCSHRDVFPVKNESKLPVVSDPEFFEKHPLFHKYNDSTYNFEWYDRGGDWRKKNKEDQAMYRYPF